MPGFQIFFQGIFTICDYCQQIETQKAITRKTAQQAMEVDPNADSDLVEASETVTFFSCTESTTGNDKISLSQFGLVSGY